MLLVYAGQSFAAFDLPCAHAKQHDMHAMHSMQHSHAQQAASHDHAQTCDCCDHAKCSMAHCASAPAVMASFQSPESAPAADAFGSEAPQLYAANAPATLYRPPISR